MKAASSVASTVLTMVAQMVAKTVVSTALKKVGYSAEMKAAWWADRTAETMDHN